MLSIYCTYVLFLAQMWLILVGIVLVIIIIIIGESSSAYYLGYVLTSVYESVYDTMMMMICCNCVI